MRSPRLRLINHKVIYEKHKLLVNEYVGGFTIPTQVIKNKTVVFSNSILIWYFPFTKMSQAIIHLYIEIHWQGEGYGV
jgi:hypothetical protein